MKLLSEVERSLACHNLRTRGVAVIRRPRGTLTIIRSDDPYVFSLVVWDLEGRFLSTFSYISPMDTALDAAFAVFVDVISLQEYRDGT